MTPASLHNVLRRRDTNGNEIKIKRKYHSIIQSGNKTTFKVGDEIVNIMNNAKSLFNVIVNGEFDETKDGLTGFHAVRFCEAKSTIEAAEMVIDILISQIKRDLFLRSINKISLKIDDIIEIESNNSREGYNLSFIYY